MAAQRKAKGKGRGGTAKARSQRAISGARTRKPAPPPKKAVPSKKAAASSKKPAPRKAAKKSPPKPKNPAPKVASKKTREKPETSKRRKLKKAVARGAEPHNTPPGKATARPKKRLKKSIAARAVARADAILQAEKDREREKQDRAKAKVTRQKALAKERKKQAKEEKKSREKAAKEFAREEERKERERIREAERRKRAAAQKARERKRDQEAREKALAVQTRKDEKMRQATERASARAAKEVERASARAAKEVERATAEKQRLVARELAEEAKTKKQAELLASREEAVRRRLKQREQSLKEKAEAKLAREKAQLETRAAAAQAKEEVRAERERARAAAALLKKTEIHNKKRESILRKQVADEIKESRKRQEKKLSASIPELVTCLIRLLAARPDIEVVRQQLGPVATPDELAKRAQDVPPEILNWYHEVGAVDFAFNVPTPLASEEGGTTGSLFVPSLFELEWTSRGRYLFLAEQNGTSEEWNSLEEYLLSRMATLFTWGNPTQKLASLARTSAPRFTPTAEIASRLLEKGLSEKAARALPQTLGAHAYLLLHESDTEEGRRRREVLDAASGQDELSLSLLDALNDGPSVGKKEWKAALEAHERFLRDGASGGSWTLELIDGLPHAKYEHKATTPPPGQALFSHQNLQGLSARGVQLSSADFCGARAVDMVFSGANLKGSCFCHALLTSANFQGADLSGCDFSGARLSGADFRKAILVDTNFERAALTNANFAGALTKGTKFGGAHVRGIRY